MEAADLQLIEKHRKSNYELDRLFKEHQDLEMKIEKFESAKALGAEEQKELNRMKKNKLAGRDRIEAMLQSLR